MCKGPCEFFVWWIDSVYTPGDITSSTIQCHDEPWKHRKHPVRSTELFSFLFCGAPTALSTATFGIGDGDGIPNSMHLFTWNVYKKVSGVVQRPFKYSLSQILGFCALLLSLQNAALVLFVLAVTACIMMAFFWPVSTHTETFAASYCEHDNKRHSYQCDTLMCMCTHTLQPHYDDTGISNIPVITMRSCCIVNFCMFSTVK